MCPSNRLQPSRSSRDRRLSSTRLLSDQRLRSIPGLMEEIQVLWNVTGSSIWWRAEVTDISELPSPSAGKSISERATISTIRYVSRCIFVAQDYKFKFIPSVSGNKTLQNLAPCSPGYITWKYPDEHVTIREDKSIRSTRSPINKIRQ